MLKKLRTCIDCKLSDLRALYKQYKLLYIIGGICVLIGIICAFADLDSVLSKYSGGNIITKIKAEEFNVILCYFKLLFFTLSMFVLGFLLTFNFFAFCVNALIIVLYTKYFFRYALISCALDGFTGYILLIILWIPILIITAYVFITYLIKLFDIVGFTCKKTTIIPYNSYWYSTRKILLNFCGCSLLFNFLYASLLILIFTIVT